MWELSLGGAGGGGRSIVGGAEERFSLRVGGGKGGKLAKIFGRKAELI